MCLVVKCGSASTSQIQPAISPNETMERNLMFEFIFITFNYLYVTVVGTGGTCTETGPFFPQTPRYMIQSGLGLRNSILLEPDWLLILILILCFIAIIAILLLALYLFRKYGWKKTLYVEPNYRKVATTFAFDNYASKV